MGQKPPRCDSCSKRIRPNHHSLLLSDALTGQTIGHYHGRPQCQAAAAKYVKGGVVLSAEIRHPDKCGPDFDQCDGGLSPLEGVA